MKIRSATRSDFSDIAAIQAESWKDAYADVMPAWFLAGQIDRDLARHWREIEIQKEDIVLVAEQGSLVGFAAAWCRPAAFIDNFHVRPSQRSKKIGSALLKALATALIDKGHKTGYLWVFENNKKAIRFYERFGGMQKEQAMKSVCGFEILSRKIEWDDLAVICANL
jgi:ribosomal protein S18 acetylase RimI-like enzyme